MELENVNLSEEQIMDHLENLSKASEFLRSETHRKLFRMVTMPRYNQKVRVCCADEKGAERSRGWIECMDWLFFKLYDEVRLEMSKASQALEELRSEGKKK